MSNATEAELAVLKVIWEQGPSLIRDIAETIYGEHSQAKHTTVKTLLERLMAKGLVACDASQYAHRFSALLTQQEYVASEIQKLADCHFSGALAPMVMTLFKHGKIGAKERKRIRQIIEETE